MLPANSMHMRRLLTASVLGLLEACAAVELAAYKAQREKIHAAIKAGELTR